MKQLRVSWQTTVVIAICVLSFLMKLPNLGHPSVKPLDEVFHAIVAASFLKHPLTPALNDPQFIPADAGNWQNAGVWLHKPPMAMWQIAISYAVLGVNTLALRLPSAILASLAVALTYLIGKELVDATAGLIAAAFQAFCAPIAMLVHGYVFSDHVDISLLFWVQAAIWLLLRGVRTGRRRDFVLAGVTQGLAVLSKSYPAMIVSVLAVVVLLTHGRRAVGRSVGSLMLATLAVVLPWVLWCLFQWPQLFLAENLHALRHLDTNVEGWAAPWDRLLFDYWIRIFHVYYPAVLVAAMVVTIRAIRLRDWRLWFLLAWGLGVLLPHLAATSKTMTATLIGWPAMWIMLGYLVSQAIQGCGMSAGALAAAMLSPWLLKSDAIPASGLGYLEQGGFATIMLEHIWVIWHVLAALAAGVFVAVARQRWLRQVLVTIAGISMLVLALRWGGDGPRGYAYLAWRVKNVQQDQPDFCLLGGFVRALPRNAAMLVDEQSKLENKLIQFASGRTCYPLGQMQWQSMGSQVIQAGGLPYLVTTKPVDLPVVWEDHQSGRTVYACSPAAKAAAERARSAVVR